MLGEQLLLLTPLSLHRKLIGRGLGQIFELLTADYLFAPQQGKTFNKDDDHMAQIIELMGDIPRRVKYGGKHSRQIFRSNGMCPRFCVPCASYLTNTLIPRSTAQH